MRCKIKRMLRAFAVVAIILAILGAALAFELWMARAMGDHLIGIVFALILIVVATGFAAPIMITPKR
jgi:uncharacterized membrane protein